LADRSQSAEKFKTFAFEVYKHADVKTALRQLFLGKCAYCETYFESNAPVDVEHYRPKAAVSDDDDHPGYWWLAMEWTNLLPSCIDCNRKRKQTAATLQMTMADIERMLAEAARAADLSSGKKDSFPTEDNRWVRGEGPIDTERPLLLDPTRDDPAAHMRWPIDAEISVVLPTNKAGQESPRGVASIAVYGLNRLGLVQERTRLFNKMRKKRSDIFDYLEMADTTTDAQMAKRLDQKAVQNAMELRDWCKPQEPYSAMAAAFVERLERDLQEAISRRGQRC
jgi:uncharacterized protein (TIGR02646 family)